MDFIVFFVALSILILVHEFGHFFAARKTGVKVEEFGLGLPPRMIGKKIGETIYSLNWLPIGGFCRLYGEDTVTDKSKPVSTRSFAGKKPWQKLLIVLGGVLMNLVLAVAIFTMVYAIMGVPRETDQVRIIGVAPDSPAAEAGIKEGDVVKSIEGIEISQQETLVEELGKRKGEEVSVVVLREGEEQGLKVMVRENPPEGQGSTGIIISNTVMEKVPWWQFYKGIGAGFKEAYFWGKIIFGGVFGMISSLFAGQVPQDVAGPIGMFQATSDIQRNQGLLAVIHFFGIISVNLAVVNILPFPALDGGRIIFVLYEMVSGRKVNERFEATINNVGMLMLLGLIFLITAGDILRIVRN